MNPTIDIGQVEGAFVMGLGAYLSEDLFYDPETGKLLNDGTWVSDGANCGAPNILRYVSYSIASLFWYNKISRITYTTHTDTTLKTELPTLKLMPLSALFVFGTLKSSSSLHRIIIIFLNQKKS